MNYEQEFRDIAVSIAYIRRSLGSVLSGLMHEVDPERAKWAADKDWLYPTSVKTVCPYCNEPSQLATKPSYQGDQAGQRILGMEGECVQCDKVAKIWIINPKLKGEQGEICESIWMLPIPQGVRQPIKKPTGLDDRIFKAYTAAVQCFNARIWTSAINECGRVIEGITEERFPSKSDREEIRQIQNRLSSDNSVEARLFRSILELSKAIRLSRKSGSHFRFTDDPDSDTAAKVIDLTEYALEYFYGLEEKARDLGDAISKLELSSNSSQ